ncbi:hypothetical protein DPEC_G00050080 [Dallia pectoralis]|uniref:Uncharacterized protein n=1 Tax=Dallia pectoralis TaxID=75939 RepID=A0ACC2HB99_DALPE|nr:hypothetical protein DPEC_G00050080 [Dallia pectoralis]
MAVFNLLNVFLSFVIVFIVETQCSPHYGVQGGEIILTPTISGKPEEILWKHNGNKVVEFDGTSNTEYGRYKGRTDLNFINGQLIIRGLTDADSGPYELEAVVNLRLQYSDHQVQVIDAVPQPSVTCKSNNSGTTLLCSADLHPLTQFLWRIPGGSETPGSELFIPVDENQESVYTCVVKNPVSNKTAEFTLKECHTVETQCSPHYGVQGGEIILTPTISGKPEEILWKHNGNKVVEFDGTSNTEYGRYKGRTDLNLINGQLIIRGLTDADSGPYQLEAIVNQMLQHSDHEVQIIDAVPQPSVTCKSNNSGTTLLCSADLHPLTQFLWRIPGGSETPGSELFIPVDENQESVYTCVVKNPVSNKTAEFTLKECHTDAKIQTQGSESKLSGTFA